MSTTACPHCGHEFDPELLAVRVTESDAATEAIGGKRSAKDTRALLQEAVEEKVRQLTGNQWADAWVLDFTDSQVVYGYGDDMWQCSYTLAEQGTVGTVTLGDPVEVVAQTWYVPTAGGDPTMSAEDMASHGQLTGLLGGMDDDEIEELAAMAELMHAGGGD